MWDFFTRRRTDPTFPEPPAFRFGVATADHQCEAYVASGRDIWDVFEDERQLQRRDLATDFWNRYGEDAQLAAELGCTAFRFSLSWARLEPQAGVWNAEAFAHYRAVLTKLHEQGLEPFVTLQHNTWPIHVENRGGMVHPDFPLWFEQYAREVAERLGDLITYYVTINEPNQLAFGYIKPWWSRAYPMPPGLKPGAGSGEQIGKVAQLIPNLFRAHARAYDAIHAVYAARAASAGARTMKPQVGANPLLLGLPPWLQRLVDRNATRVRTTGDLAKQGRRLTERRLLESGAADVVMAQLTLTPQRTEGVEFSESYFVAHLALLSRGAPPAAAGFEDWRGHVAATRGTTAVEEANARFRSATVVVVESIQNAVALLRSQEVELVLDDDVVLRPFATDGLALTVIAGTDAPYAAAVAPGNRDLLNAIDAAIRAYKETATAGTTQWQAALQAHLHAASTELPPKAGRRANASAETRNAPPVPTPDAPTYGQSALEKVRTRSMLKVAVHPGIPGLCTRTTDGSYVGLEPDLARFVAAEVCGDASRVRFVEVSTDARMTSVRSWLRWLDPILRVASVFSTIVTTNWWYLGLSGKLKPFLCPAECVGKLDYVGLDYYWGISSLGFNRIARLFAASEQKYASAPVWPKVLRAMLHEHATMFPGKALFVIENGSVDVADGIARGLYLQRHIGEVQRARAEGVPVDGYLCWAITSNREWGLPFDKNSDFGLYHIDLDTDPMLKRRETPSGLAYGKIVKARSAT